MSPDRPAPRRVFLAHTAELSRVPSDRSFVDAAKDAVSRVGDAIVNMQYFGPRNERPSAVCRHEVQGSDVFVLIVGFRRGSEVRDMPGRTYTEWEFECATEVKLPRLVFLLGDETRATSELLVDPNPENGTRQAAWRAQLRDSGLVVATVPSPDRLETALALALRDLPHPEQPRNMTAPDAELVEHALRQHLQADDHYPAHLTGRHDELADLADFCRGTERYAWRQGAPYTGKSALAAWVVRHPPAGVDVVSFFVAGGFPDEANSDGYVTALSAQLRSRYGAKLEAGEGAGGRRRRLNERLAVTAQRLAAEQRSLLVVVDGLSEDRSAGLGLPSIASLLPRNPPEGIHFFITSRPLLRVPDDVHEQHPLRTCTVRTVTASRHVGRIDPRANLEIAQFVSDDPLCRSVLGLVAVAGRLTLSELDELTQASSGAVDRALRSGLGHCLVHATDRPALPAHEPGLALAHDALRDAVLRLHRRSAGELRKLITRWAESYRAAGWPGDTPDYLLTDYPSFLAGIGNVEGLVACVADSERHDRMLATTGNDVAALAEIEHMGSMVDAGRLADRSRWATLLAERERIIARSGLRTTEDIARRLDITRSYDLDRIIETLPRPVDLGAGRSAWRRSDVERVASLPVRHPGVQTQTAEALGAVRPPLERVVDECIDFHGSRVHVRIWKGRAEEGDRVVVVLGALHGKPNHTVNRVEELAGVVDIRFLDGCGGAATWFDYDIREGKHEIDNIVLETPPRRWRRRRSGGSDIAERFVDNSAQWAPTGIAGLERAVGAPVECYPESAYTEETISEWQRRLRDQVVVENDVAGLRGLVAAITRLGDVAPDDSRAALAEAACIDLADEIDMRREVEAVRRWDDGTKPRYVPVHSKWPRLFAARLAPARLGSRDEERVARHRGERVWPWPESDLARRELLDRLLGWRDDVGEHGDHPDQELCAAVSRAADVLEHWIFVAQGDAQAAPPGERTSRVWGPVAIACDLDEWYRRTFRFGPTPEDTPVHRALRALFLDDCADHLRLGRDPQGRAVAYDPGTSACGGPLFAVDWPHEPPSDGIPEGTCIVSGGEAGDRPAYLERPHADTLELLPRPPGSWRQWNFGYSGGGPSALTHAICRLLELVDGVEHDVFPWDWVDGQVSTSDKHLLRISVDEIRLRYSEK